MNTAVDNIEVDQETGDLWIGCHPILYRILDELRVKGKTLPSMYVSLILRGYIFQKLFDIVVR